MAERKKASDVFLALVQENVQNYSLDVFRELMATWQEIVDLEAIASAMLESLPTPEPVPEEKPKRKRHEKTTGEGHGVTEWAVRKRAALGALAKARAADVTFAQLADASGLTITDILDMNNGKKRAIPYWTCLEKGLKKLGFPPGGEEARDEDGQTAD